MAEKIYLVFMCTMIVAFTFSTILQIRNLIVNHKEHKRWKLRHNKRTWEDAVRKHNEQYSPKDKPALRVIEGKKQ